jgi:SAM-dependent methyltransferase
VFNYHQNFRDAVELIGWDVLKIAQSEFGSNRKHRQNRFLTVIQYCLDMLDFLKEIRRLLKKNGRAILIVGRESNIRGIGFKNGTIVAALAIGAAGFRLEKLQERIFTNRFGAGIYEDIIHLVPSSFTNAEDELFARELSDYMLSGELAKCEEGEVKEDLSDALKKIDKVAKSQLFTTTQQDLTNYCFEFSNSVVNL